MTEEKIQWLCEGCDLPHVDFAKLEVWIREVITGWKCITGPLTYIFCDDDTILRVNRQYLGHDYYTDIITFDYRRGRRISGDIYLSLATVASNAASLGVDPGRELLRVVIHGVLHLLGVNDKGPGERAVMEAHEDAALALWDKL